MAVTIQIPRSQEIEFRTAFAAGIGCFQDVLRCLSEHPAVSSFAEAEELAVQATTYPPEASKAVIRIAFGLAVLRQGTTDSPSEIMDGVERGLQETKIASRLKLSDLPNWQGIKPVLVTLVGLPCIYLFAKATTLAHSHEQEIQSVRIVTDVRGVFSEGDKDIPMVVARNLLQIEYQKDGNTHTIEFSIDESDIASLQDACSRTAVKLQKLSTLFDSNKTKFGVAGRSI